MKPETDAEYLRRFGRELYSLRPRGLVPAGKALANIADRLEALTTEGSRMATEAAAMEEALHKIIDGAVEDEDALGALSYRELAEIARKALPVSGSLEEK